MYDGDSAWERILKALIGGGVAALIISLFLILWSISFGKPKKVKDQIVENIENSEYHLVNKIDEGKSVCLYNSELNRNEIWNENKHYAGYVLLVDGKEYEFSSEAGA